MPLIGSINLTPTGLSGEQFQTEISAYVSFGSKLYVLSSGGGPTLQVTDASNPASPLLLGRIDYEGYTSTSVAAYKNLVAVALIPSGYDANPSKGVVRFFRMLSNGTLRFLENVTVGYQPDGVAFANNGRQLVIANEGQPSSDYSQDPNGSVGIIDIQNPLSAPVFAYTDLDFTGAALPDDLRISGPSGTAPGQDIEPEFVGISADGRRAYVTVQENNGVAIVDLLNRRIESIQSLGSVDYGKLLVDLSDQDGPSNSLLFLPKLGQNYSGLRMPDGIGVFKAKNVEYYITANEGDAREYGAYADVSRNSESPNGRLNTIKDPAPSGPSTNISIGSRSLSIFNAKTGALVWDSGDMLQTIATAAGTYDDKRSDDKGVEVEGVVTTVYGGRTYAIAALERGVKTTIVVVDISNPAQASYVSHLVIETSVSPEGLQVLDAKNSPTKRPQLIVSNEISNTLDFIDLERLIDAPGVGMAGSFKPTMLKDVAGGSTVEVTSLITNGEFTKGIAKGSGVFAPTGIFDGQGAYDNRDGTYTLLVNSELGESSGYAYSLPGVDGILTGARISGFVVDKDMDNDASNGYQSSVLKGGLAYDKIYLDGSSAPIDAVSDLGAAGFKRFCSANLVEARGFAAKRGFRDRIFLVGEEEFAGVGGSFFALDVKSRALHEVVGFGKGTWESATLIDTGKQNTVAVLLFDDAKAPLYMWVGTKSTASGASFLERNGLAAGQGSLYTFVTDVLGEDNVSVGPDSSDLFAFTKLNGLNQGIAGRWVDLATLNPSYSLLGAPDLRSLAVGAGALQLSRIEDGDVNPLNSQQAVFVTTGTKDFAKGDLYGNVMTLDFSSSFGRNGRLKTGASTMLKVVYDGDLLTDPTTGIRNPDNLTISSDGFVYLQEDRANGGGVDIGEGHFGTQEASIWKLGIDPLTGTSSGMPERWLQIDRTAVPSAYGQSQPAYTNPDRDGVGNWESSGIIDVSSMYGTAAGSYFIANVQAHSLSGGNIGGSGYLAEGGQIDLIKQISGSVPV
jgi:hypothetical protein